MAVAMASPHATSLSRGQSRIGPNAILQVVTELRARFGDAVAGCALCSTPWRLDHLPTGMVPERDVVELVRGTHRVLGHEGARVVLDAAGVRTARYLLANRIPRVIQVILRVVPAPLALRVLLTMIGRNSWTFAGGARFAAHIGVPTVIELHDCAMCAGLHGGASECRFYAGTFRELVRALVDATADVEETECAASGGTVCRFVIRLRTDAAMS